MKTKSRTRWLIWLAAVLLTLAGITCWWFLSTRPPIPFLDPAAHLPAVENIPTGSQLLIYPIQQGVVTAGYRNPTYLQKNGYAHYGIDYTSHDAGFADVVAGGTGTVLDTESNQNSLGNILVIRYDHVYNPTTTQTLSLIARYYHLLTATVQAGDVVAAGQVIGTINGSHASYHHVHIELDTNLNQPFNTPQVAEASSRLLNRYPATGESLLEPTELMVLGAGQFAYIHPNSDCCQEKDNPRYRAK